MARQDRKIALIHGLLAPLACFRALEGMIQAGEARSIHLPGYGDNRGISLEGLTLSSQARFAAKAIEEMGWKRTWVMGHSVGGAVTMLLADQRPDLIEGVINAEGNFTLGDAFWSSRISKTPPEAWAAEYASMQADPEGWMKRGDVNATPQALAWTRDMLESQPAETIQAVAKAVIAETTPPTYLEALRRVVDRGTPLHLLAGERAASGWHVTDWARAAARSFTIMPDTGHMMMMEEPHEFCLQVDKIVSGIQG